METENGKLRCPFAPSRPSPADASVQPENPKDSGVQTVMAGSIFAVIGALSLQHGSKFASRIVRERILRRIRLNV